MAKPGQHDQEVYLQLGTGKAVGPAGIAVLFEDAILVTSRRRSARARSSDRSCEAWVMVTKPNGGRQLQQP